jgi:sterol desaturase/sphingolipid hydroxylase (fatty acid hydroxylase superfamily)
VLLFTVVGFVADDFTRYVVHRAMHAFPALWQIHQVHHSAEVLTPATVYRVHPVEVFLHQVRGRATLGLVCGVFAYVAPGATWVEVLGVDVMTFAWCALGANLRHSQVWLSYGPSIERLVISPAQHQLHHSADRAHWDRNFGSAFAVWDALFGTLLRAGPRQRLRYGLEAPARNHAHAPLAMLWRPVVGAVSVLLALRPRAGAARLHDRLGPPLRERAADHERAAEDERDQDHERDQLAARLAAAEVGGVVRRGAHPRTIA